MEEENTREEDLLVDNMFLTNEAYSYLKSSVKLAKYLSITGFLFIGITAFFAILAIVVASSMEQYIQFSKSFLHSLSLIKWHHIIIYLLMLSVYYFPFYFLYKYSTISQRALYERNSLMLEDGLKYLKKHHISIGGLTIVVVSFCLISFAIMLVKMYTVI